MIATLAAGFERVLLETLPYKDARRLVVIRESGRRDDVTWVPWLDIDAWQRKTRSFEEIGFLTGDRKAVP